MLAVDLSPGTKNHSSHRTQKMVEGRIQQSYVWQWKWLKGLFINDVITFGGCPDQVADDYIFSSTAHSMFWFDMTLEMYFDILIVRHELPDAATHVTRRRARPPMPPFQILGHCTDMLHSNLLHMTTLFSILVNDYNKTGYLVYCFYKWNKSPTSLISFSSWVATLALSITMSL